MKSILPSLLLALVACGGAAPEAPPAPPAEAPAEAAPTPAAASTGDAAHGAEVVGQKCTSCHGAEVNTRPDHRVTTPEALTAQVETCGGAAHLDATEKADVVAHLRGTYGF